MRNSLICESLENSEKRLVQGRMTADFVENSSLRMLLWSVTTRDDGREKVLAHKRFQKFQET